MAFLDFLKKEKAKEEKVPENKIESKIIKSEEEEEWGNLLPILTPLSLTNFDSIEMSRNRDDEVFAKKYRLRTTPLQGYEI